MSDAHKRRRRQGRSSGYAFEVDMGATEDAASQRPVSWGPQKVRSTFWG